MIQYVIKRDGTMVNFDEQKILNSVLMAFQNTHNNDQNKYTKICNEVIKALKESPFETITTPLINKVVLSTFNSEHETELYDAFKTERIDRDTFRERNSDLMQSIKAIGTETERDNANVGNNFSAKLLQIASASNKKFNLMNMPSEHAKYHMNGDIHLHDLDSWNLTTNCLHIDLKHYLQTGFNTGYGYIRPPKRLESAGELACIILQSTQNDMFGGQSFCDFDNAFTDIIKATRESIKEEYSKITSENVDDAVEEKLNKTISQTMQGIIYNLNTMHSRAGSQVPFSSVNIGLPTSAEAAKVCEAFLIEYSKGLGNGEQPIFPNIIFRLKKGVNANPEDKYFYLRELAEKVAAKRMNPTFMNIDNHINKEYYDKGIIPAMMGCRTALLANVNGTPGPNRRGNIAPTSINLVRIGIQADNWDKFYELLDNMMDVAKDTLMVRKKALSRLKVKDIPFVCGQKFMLGSDNLEADDSIEPVLRQGSWAIGFIGLAETLTAMMGCHHGESDEAYAKALEIITHMNNRIKQYVNDTGLNFTLYATPAEGLSGRFVKMDKEKFGIIKGVTDKDYYTNSFHIPVKFPISITNKLKLEAPFHSLCTGGKISYIELDGDSVSDRALLIHRSIDYALNNTDIDYWAYNFHIRYCKECGASLLNDHSKCPVCGSHKIQGVSRVTGYMSLDERFAPGKKAERADRINHTWK